MTIYRLERARQLRVAGFSLGRSGISERVVAHVTEFVEKDGSYKGAMKLVGKLKALGQAAGFDDYWTEQVDAGFTQEQRTLAAPR